jgi:subtilisin family serine protease
MRSLRARSSGSDAAETSAVALTLALLSALAACHEPAGPARARALPDGRAPDAATGAWAASAALHGANTATNSYLVSLKTAPGESRGAAVDRVIARLTDRGIAAPGVMGRRIERAGIGHRYRHALAGFAARLTAGDARALAQDRDVLAVEPDSAASIDAVGSWGIDRIDERSLPLSGSYTPPATGAGVRVYLIDTGIWQWHQEFTGRVAGVVSRITGDTSTVDCNGHGTHVAGTAGGSTVGAARGVSLVSVRVFGCSGVGTASDVLAGVDYVASQKAASPDVPMVANMSFRMATSQTAQTAVQNLLAAGVVVVASAGNSSTDACGQLPAAIPGAITVAATDIYDTQATFTNVGKCVDLYAPGVNIRSAKSLGNTGYMTLSGTSMAAPHAAGAAAIVLTARPRATPSDVAQALVNAATVGAIRNVTVGTPNRLLYVRNLAPTGS